MISAYKAKKNVKSVRDKIYNKLKNNKELFDYIDKEVTSASNLGWQSATINRKHWYTYMESQVEIEVFLSILETLGYEHSITKSTKNLFLYWGY